MRRVLMGTAAALLTAATLQAQAGLTGTWQGASPGGSAVVLEARATETELAGTLTVDGQRLPIAEGKVKKNTLAFTVTLPPNESPEAFSGEFEGDELKIWMNRRGPASPAVLKRVKR